MADNLSPFVHADCLEIWKPQLLVPSGLSWPVLGLLCLLFDTRNAQRFYASVTD